MVLWMWKVWYSLHYNQAKPILKLSNNDMAQMNIPYSPHCHTIARYILHNNHICVHIFFNTVVVAVLVVDAVCLLMFRNKNTSNMKTFPF